MSADVWESHDRVTGPYCRTCGSDSVGCSDCHEAEIAGLRATLAQVTAERDAKEAQYAEAVKSGVELATELATLRADLAAQVDGMTYTTMQTEADEFYGREGLSFVSRDEVLTLLRGPHAD